MEEERGGWLEMLIFVRGLSRDEWQRPVVEIVFKDIDFDSDLNSLKQESSPHLTVTFTGEELWLLRRLLVYCQRLNETTPWQRRMMADLPGCMPSFLPMLDGTAGGVGGRSPKPDPEEFSTMLFLREPICET